MVLCSTLRETQGDEFVQNLIRQPGDFKDNLKKVTNKLLFTYEPVTFDANADVYPFSWTMYEQYQTDIKTEMRPTRLNKSVHALIAQLQNESKSENEEDKDDDN